jgi:hypothetical protein
VRGPSRRFCEAPRPPFGCGVGVVSRADSCSAFTSRAVSSREWPTFKPGSRSGPNWTRDSVTTGCPTASHIRRTWRLRPSRRVMSTIASEPRGVSSRFSTRTVAGAVRWPSSGMP